MVIDGLRAITPLTILAYPFGGQRHDPPYHHSPMVRNLEIGFEEGAFISKMDYASVISICLHMSPAIGLKMRKDPFSQVAR